MGITSREPGTVRGTTKRPHFSLAFISVTVQLWTWVFWVISLYFNIRNTVPKFCPFLLGHPVCIYTKFSTQSSMYLKVTCTIFAVLVNRAHKSLVSNYLFLFSQGVCKKSGNVLMSQ